MTDSNTSQTLSRAVILVTATMFIGWTGALGGSLALGLRSADRAADFAETCSAWAPTGEDLGENAGDDVLTALAPWAFQDPHEGILLRHAFLWLLGGFGMLAACVVVLSAERRRREAVLARLEADEAQIAALHAEGRAREEMIELLMDTTDEYEDGIIEVEKLQEDLIEGKEHLETVNSMLEELANTDVLTKLYNRRKGNAILEDEWARMARGVSSVGVIMIDIDHFKRVNDTYGHGAGDMVLTEIAARIHRTIRAYDSAIRWGGEEMLVVCPESSATDIVATAERLRVAIGGEEIAIDEGAIHVTASFGVATSDDGAFEAISDLIASADSALYRAKDGGRDRVCLSDCLSSMPPPTLGKPPMRDPSCQLA